MTKGKTELAKFLHSELTELLKAKSINSTEHSAMQSKERERKGVPLSYRAYCYLKNGELKLKAPKLAIVAEALNLEINTETIYFVKRIE